MMCAGEFHPMKIDIRPGDWVIAVDGGLKYLELCGIEPDFLLGFVCSIGLNYLNATTKDDLDTLEIYLRYDKDKDTALVTSIILNRVVGGV